MADGYAANDLTPHDIVVTDRTAFTAQGGVVTVKSVSYFVGAHGPFTDEYKPAEATAERIQQGINNQIRLLRDVVSATYPST